MPQGGAPARRGPDRARWRGHVPVCDDAARRSRTMSQQLSDHAPPESGALRQAALLDADGRHEEAVNTLARAARFGDADAMTELGKRLITGERAPALPRQGAGLLIDATNRGAAEAPALLAILAATGVECEQS